jgi:hypothetical protein
LVTHLVPLKSKGFGDKMLFAHDPNKRGSQPTSALLFNKFVNEIFGKKTYETFQEVDTSFDF